MNLNRKRKKELRNLRSSATTLWEQQQQIAAEAAQVAREAGRQLGNFSREQVVPTVQSKYDATIRPHVERGTTAGKSFLNGRVFPAVGTAIGTTAAAIEAAKRRGSLLKPVPLPEPKKNKGGVLAIILGAAAALGVLYAAWQTLRSDDELWVADDPFNTPKSV